jgi:hypothetical protein
MIDMIGISILNKNFTSYLPNSGKICEVNTIHNSIHSEKDTVKNIISEGHT